MTSAVSKKYNPAFGLFKATLAKNMGIMLLLLCGMLILCPGLFLASLERRVLDHETFNANHPEYLDALFGFLGVTSCIAVIIGNYMSFSYLYKKNSSDVFHALPITRAKLLISRAAASFVTVAVPVTLGYASLFALTAFYPTCALGTFSQIFSAYIVNIVCMAAISSYSLIFIICAGSTFDLILSFAGFNAGSLVIGFMIADLASENLSGYSSQSMADIFKFTSFPAYCGIGAARFAEGDGYAGYLPGKNAGYIICTLLFALFFFAASVLLYNRRKAERGGQPYAYKFIYVVCSIIAGVCGGYILSPIFVFVSGSRLLSVIGIVSFAVGATLTAVVYGAVTERGFKKFTNSLIYGGISLAVYLVVFAVIANGAFGFSSRIPDEKNIESAFIEYRGYSIELDNAGPVIALHKAIIEKDADDFNIDNVDTYHEQFMIIYNLKDGGKFYREYFADIEKVGGEMFSVLNSNERFEDWYKALDGVRESGLYINVFDENGDSFDCKVTKEDCKNLIKIYKEEFKTKGMEIVNANKTGDISVYLQGVGNSYDEYVLSFETNGNFTETRALINTFERIEY